MIFLIGCGGILGALSRYYLGKWIMSRRSFVFPIGTWTINITGSLLLGVLFSLHTSSAVPEWVWGVFGVGFCGAYTTFSTFGFETVSLMESGKIGRAAIYVLSTVSVGLLAAFIGIWIM